MYRVLKFSSIIIPRLPGWSIPVLADIAGLVAFLIATKARKQASSNMIHVLGKDVVRSSAGRRRLRRTVIRMFQNNARNYLDLFTLPYLSPNKILNLIDVKGIEHLEQALALGKGVILFSAHFGPFNYLAQWISIKGYRLVIPVEQLKDERTLDLTLKLRNSQGVQFLPLGGSAPIRTMIKALRNNQIVLITADRAVEGESVEKLFFGEPARLPLGPVALSQRTGAALVGACGWYTSRTHIEGKFFPLTLELTEDERKNTDTVMCALIERLEMYIKAHPEQWIVFSPVWVSERAVSPLGLQT
jgi:phosphatidylinositol dimannoside acyltransferase